MKCSVVAFVVLSLTTLSTVSASTHSRNASKSELDSKRLNEMETLLDDLERFQLFWSVVYEHKSVLNNFEPYIKTDRKLNQLLFDTVPSILQSLKISSFPSNFLQRPFLLDVPSVSKRVSVAPSSQDFLNYKVLRKLSRVSNLRASFKNDNSILGSVFLKPPQFQALQNKNNTTSYKRQKDESSDFYQKRLQSISSSQKKLLEKMKALKNKLDELTKLKFQNENVKSTIVNIKSQLEDLEERKSELYYKRLTLSQNTWS